MTRKRRCVLTSKEKLLKKSHSSLPLKFSVRARIARRGISHLAKHILVNGTVKSHSQTSAFDDTSDEGPALRNNAHITWSYVLYSSCFYSQRNEIKGTDCTERSGRAQTSNSVSKPAGNAVFCPLLFPDNVSLPPNFDTTFSFFSLQKSLC